MVILYLEGCWNDNIIFGGDILEGSVSLWPTDIYMSLSLSLSCSITITHLLTSLCIIIVSQIQCRLGFDCGRWNGNIIFGGDILEGRWNSNIIFSVDILEGRWNDYIIFGGDILEGIVIL